MRKLALFFMLMMNAFSLPAYAVDAAVAKVNNAVITKQELEEAVSQLIPGEVYHGKVSEEKRDELRQKALDSLIERELQYLDAVAKGMKPEKKLVNEKMDQVRSRFNSKKEYKKALQDAGLTEDRVREFAAKAVLIEASIRANVDEKARVGEAELKEYYDKHVGNFKEPEGVRVRILSSMDEKIIAQAQAELKAGKDFGDTAEDLSQDQYRVKGGDLGYVHRGRILPELEEAAFKMKPGEVSGPIKAEEKWFLVKVEDKKPERQVSFEDAREKLKTDMEKNRATELKDKWLAGLRAQAKIEVLWKPSAAAQEPAQAPVSGGQPHH